MEHGGRYVLADYDGRYGFNSLVLIKLRKQGLRQIDLGTKISEEIAGAMVKESHDKEVGGASSVYLRAGEDGKVRIRAVATNNPKEMDTMRTYCALFQGTSDMAREKWTVTDVRSVPADAFDRLSMAYSDFATATYPDEQSKAEGYDRTLNDVCAAWRLVLPKANFEAGRRSKRRGWSDAMPRRIWRSGMRSCSSGSRKCSDCFGRESDLRGPHGYAKGPVKLGGCQDGRGVGEERRCSRKASLNAAVFSPSTYESVFIYGGGRDGWNLARTCW